MKLYVDDLRTPNDNVYYAVNLLAHGYLNCVIARSFHEAIYALSEYNFNEVSLDHDLGEDSFYGPREMSGYDILQWLIARKQKGLWVPAKIRCHSANPESKKMNEDIKRYWGEQL